VTGMFVASACSVAPGRSISSPALSSWRVSSRRRQSAGSLSESVWAEVCWWAALVGEGSGSTARSSLVTGAVVTGKAPARSPMTNSGGPRLQPEAHLIGSGRGLYTAAKEPVSICAAPGWSWIYTRRYGGRLRTSVPSGRSL
jgi:hypothetical protein